MESSFVKPEDVRADTDQQRNWAVGKTTAPEYSEPLEAPFDPPLGFEAIAAEHAAREAEDGPQDPPEPQEDPDPFAGFDERIRLDVEGLEYLGYLEDTFSFAGHNFTIKTLHGEEELAAGLAISRYRGTIKEPDAWIWAQTAMCLKAVDGDANFCPPIGPDIDDYAQARFRYATQKWFFPFIEWIYYNRYLPLQQRAIAAMEALQSKSQRNRSPLSPTSGSLTELGISSASSASTPSR